MGHQLRRSVILNTIGNVLFFLCQYIMLILVTRLGGLYQSGLLSTAMNIANVCLSLAGFGMRTFQASDFHHHYSDSTYLRSRYVTTLLTGVGCAAFAFANSYTMQQRWVILVYTLCRLSEAVVDVWHGYLQRGDRMDLVGISFGARGLLSILALILGLHFGGSLLLALMLMTLLNWGFILAADIPLARDSADFFNTEGGSVPQLLWVCLPLAIYSFLNSAVGAVPKYFCERIVGTELFALFNNVFSPVQILQVGAAYIFVPFITVFAHAWLDKNGKKFIWGLGIAAASMVVLWLGGTLFVLIAGHFCLNLMYGAETAAYAPLLYPLVTATVITTFVLILCHLLTIMRAMRGLIVSNLIGIIASCLVSAPLIRAYGIYGAATATILSRLVQALAMLLILLWHCKKQFLGGDDKPEAA